MDCVNLKERFGKRYKVRYKESYYADHGDGARAEDPWLMIMLCQHGHIFPQGDNILAASTNGRGSTACKLLAMPNTTVWQDGSDGVTVLFDTGTPAIAEGFGAKSGQWTASKNYPCCLDVFGDFDNTDKIMVARLHSINKIIGKTAGALSQGSNATINVWGGAGNSEAVISSLTLTAYDWLLESGADDIASGKKVVVEWINGVPYVTAAECA